MLGGLILDQIGDDMEMAVVCFGRTAVLFSGWLLLTTNLSFAQQDVEPGHSIGKVSTQEGLIVMELDEGALEKANLFDLTGHTLRFTPEGTQYRIENSPLVWDSDDGTEITGAEVTLHTFDFPFSGHKWKSFLVGNSGSIRFGASEKDAGFDPYGHRDGGVILGRFDELASVADKLIDQAPVICVFLKPRTSGHTPETMFPDSYS